MTVETEPDTEERILDVTEAALEKVLEILADEDEPAGLALRVEITGVAGVEYRYDLAFEALAEAADDDVVYTIGDLSIIVPAQTVSMLATSMAPTSTTAMGPASVSNTLTTRSLRANRSGT